MNTKEGNFEISALENLLEDGIKGIIFNKFLIIVYFKNSFGREMSFKIILYLEILKNIMF